MRVRHAVEIGAWILGISLMLAYVAARAWSERERQLAVDAFKANRATPTAWVTAPRVAAPDQSLWSRQRVAAFAATSPDPAMPIALLRVPGLRLEVPVFDDTSERSLNRGAGHIEGTALPGPDGNIGIAAHRDGFFRVLKDIELGQILELQTPALTLHYKVTELRIVEPKDISVLAQTSQPTVTLVTCYPFYVVGSAPLRFIVRAERADVHLAAANSPGTAEASRHVR